MISQRAGLKQLNGCFWGGSTPSSQYCTWLMSKSQKDILPVERLSSNLRNPFLQFSEIFFLKCRKSTGSDFGDVRKMISGNWRKGSWRSVEHCPGVCVNRTSGTCGRTGRFWLSRSQEFEGGSQSLHREIAGPLRQRWSTCWSQILSRSENPIETALKCSEISVPDLWEAVYSFLILVGAVCSQQGLD